MKRHLLIILIMYMACVAGYAQSTKAIQQYYLTAHQFYHTGRFDSCEVYSRRVVSMGSGMLKSSAYRLLALTRLERGDIAGAATIIDRLLAYDPYFTPAISDPQRFIDMIDERKQRETGVTTASRQAESITEAPVPVTLITEAMIRHSGAQTISELLCLYVPGMSAAEGQEANIAMHGIAGLSQEKILFMQDGHRLNSSSTNSEAPDYRISLDKIQQIEVLRGPASSLYGNVALTAVVNIITRKGAAINGARISGIIGTQNTYGTSFTIGGGNNVVDIMGWGSVQGTDGFKHVMDNVAYHPGNNCALTPQSTLYAHGFNRRPSFDIGLKGEWLDFTLTYNSQRSKQNPYINIFQMPATKRILYDEQMKPYLSPEYPVFDAVQNYNTDRYSNIRSNGPGVTRTNHRLNIDYSHSFGNIDLEAAGYVSLESTSLYNVMGDSVDFFVGANMLMKLQQGVEISGMTQEMEEMLLKFYVKTQGVFQVMEWESITAGGQAQLLAKYNFLGRGNAVLGCQYEHFALTDGVMYLGGNYSPQQMVSSGSVFNDGTENSYSSYAQLKHLFSNRFILNAGLRFDHKVRFDDAKLNRFSPRFSLIYKFHNDITARASYNYSFVDAPYIYRACNVRMFSGGKYMEPETMRSLQIGATYHRPGTGLTAEVSAYYNSLYDLVTINLGAEYLFQNAGKVKQTGVEGMVQYSSNNLFFNANMTWQRLTMSERYSVYDNNPLGVPQLLGNMTLAYSPYHSRSTSANGRNGLADARTDSSVDSSAGGFFSNGKLWLRGTLNAQSTTYYQTTDIILSSALQQNINQINKVNPQLVLSLSVGYEWKHLDLDLMLQNITNNEYKVGSILFDGVPRKGRQFVAKATVKF